MNDHFSRQAEFYSSFRPEYPPELFRFLAALTPEREIVWDAATGSGQAAKGLVLHFDKVFATDISKSQLDNAFDHQKIEYKVESAECTSLKSETVDLVTCAQAVHWLNFSKFYDEVNRVTKEYGVIAVWCYDLLKIKHEIDFIIMQFYSVIVGEYWPPERRYIDEKYETIPFPFDVIDTPDFEMTSTWTFQQLSGYLRSWSSVQRYIDDRGDNPVDLVIDDLEKAWGDIEEKREINWPLILKVGRV